MMHTIHFNYSRVDTRSGSYTTYSMVYIVKLEYN